MSKPFIPASQDRIDAINKNLDERGRKEADDHQEKMKNHKPFKAYQRPTADDVDQEILNKQNKGII